MSAIAGVIRLDGAPVDEAVVPRMLATLAHRGATSSVFAYGPLAVGARRRAWERDGGPVRDKGGAVLVGDVRLDEPLALAAELGLPAGATDGEIALAAWRRWGDDAPGHLLGDFAFVVWDAAKRTVFAARDPFGLRPLYLAVDGERLAFASEIKALLALPEVARGVSPLRLAEYVAGSLPETDHTFYAAVRRLLPGHRLQAKTSSVHTERWWRPDATREERLPDDAAYAEGFRERLETAVRRRLPSAKLGVTLSGGLDSSSVAVTAQRLVRRKLPSFSAIVRGDPDADETAWIRAITDRGGFLPHEIPVDDLDPLADVDATLAVHDEPFVDPQMFVSRAIYAAAREAGVEALTTGFDGDSVVGIGWERLGELAGAGRIGAAARESALVARYFELGPWEMFRKFAVPGLVPDAVRSLRGRFSRRSAPGGLLREDFRRRVGLQDHLASLRTPVARTHREAHAAGWTSAYTGFAAEVLDRGLASYGMGAVCPYLDRDLAEWCVALPSEQKLKDGWNRVVVRRAMAGALPESVRWRGGKANLAGNFDRNLRKHGAERVRAWTSDLGALEDVLDPAAVRTSVDRWLAEGGGWNAMEIWTVTLLVRWFSGKTLTA